MKKLSVILCLLLGANSIHAQTMQQAEQQIKAYLDGISYWRFEYSAEDTSFGHQVSAEDSLNRINDELFAYLKNRLAKVPGILKRPLSIPQANDMTIVSSQDKKLSIYSWNTHKSGDDELYAAVALYEHNGVKAFQIGALPGTEMASTTYPVIAGPYVEILQAGSAGKTIYLPIMKLKAEGSKITKSIFAYTIDGGITEQPAFFVKNNSGSGNIDISYDYSANYDFDKMKETYVIHLSKNGKKLYIPVVESNGQLNGRWDVYTFDGSKFVYEGVE